MQASPLLDGFSLSPATLVMTPSSTLTDNPQPTPQKPQIVVSSRAPLTLPFSWTFSVAVAIVPGSPLCSEVSQRTYSNCDGPHCPTRPVDTCLASNYHSPCRIGEAGGGRHRVLIEGEDHRRARLQQVADSASGADGPLEHRRGLCFQRVQEPAGGAVRGGPDADRDHLQHQHRYAGSIGRRVRHMGGARGAARGDVHRSPVLVWRVRRRGPGGGHP